MIRLSIIVLNFRKPQLTINCLQSLYRQYKKAFEQNVYELVIVDNYSQDNSVAELHKEIKKGQYKNIILVENKENKGFGAGCNVGAARSQGQYILFLNNDTEVTDDSLEKMILYMEKHQKVSILGGQLRNIDGSLQSSVGRFYTPFRFSLLMLSMQRLGLVDQSPRNIHQVDWVKGALMMVRRDCFNQLGGFDENIFMYIEDMEFCYRAKRAGFHTYFYPDVHITHQEHGSTNRTFAIVNIYKNILYFYKKHRSFLEYHYIHLLLWTKAKILVMIGRITKNAYLITTYEEALTVIR